MLLLRICRPFFRFPAALAAVLFLAVACCGQQSQVGNVVCEIRVARQGIPSEQILVTLLCDGSPINSAYSYSQGHFGFYALPGGVYTVSIQDEDCLPVT